MRCQGCGDFTARGDGCPVDGVSFASRRVELCQKRSRVEGVAEVSLGRSVARGQVGHAALG